METPHEPGLPNLAAHRLELAAACLQHLFKIEKEQASIEHIVASLEQTITDAHANYPEDLCDMMAVQTRILDAAFNYFLEQSKIGNKGDNLAMALKAQNQVVRTINTWKKVKTETYIKHKIKYYTLPKKNHDERTGQSDASMDF